MLSKAVKRIYDFMKRKEEQIVDNKLSEKD